MNALQLFKDTIKEHPDVKIKLLIPNDEQMTATIGNAKLESPQVEFRIYQESLKSRITIVLVDKRECIIVETKDDAKEDSYAAVVLSVYSNSKSLVLSYASIFESLWKQTELYEQLKIHDKMQKEFTEEGTISVSTEVKGEIDDNLINNNQKEEGVHPQKPSQPGGKGRKQMDFSI